MKQPATVLKRVLLGAVLIALSACLSMVIKESLDTQDPESALPILTVTCDGTPITDVYRAGYVWSFFATMERRTPQLLEEDLPLVPVDVNPQAEVRMAFSTPPSQLQVQRAQGLGSRDYLQVVSDDPSVFRAPTEPGVYVYKVLASWSGRGYIQYYFALQVRDLSPPAASSAPPASSGADAPSSGSGPASSAGSGAASGAASGEAAPSPAGSGEAGPAGSRAG